MKTALILLGLAAAGIAAISVTLLRKKQTVSDESEKENQPNNSVLFKNAIDAIIFENAKEHSLDPVLIKAVCAKESSFDPLAINPEKSGISASALRNEILGARDGGDSVLKKFDVNPSIGIMQVRVTTARDFESNITPIDLFHVNKCIRIGCKFIAWLRTNGVPLETRIDAYNVGLGGFRKGHGSAAYRKDVYDFAKVFANDFDRAKGVV